MKLLLTTIAAVLLVGCGPSVDIHEAVSKGNIEAVKQHIAAGTDVNARNELGITPLSLATGGGYKEIVELLIAKGADVNAKFGIWTPLHIAAFRGRKEVAELLINEGADVNAKNKNGDTPLDFTINMKKTETAELLRKHGGKNGTIHGAAGGGDIEAVKEFLAAGADVNAKSNGGWTPLHSAANKEIAELLIAKGADVNAKNGFGQTPLDAAKNHPETAALLRKHGGKTGEELKAEGK